MLDHNISHTELRNNPMNAHRPTLTFGHNSNIRVCVCVCICVYVLAMPAAAACRSSWARDQTLATAVTTGRVLDPTRELPNPMFLKERKQIASLPNLIPPRSQPLSILNLLLIIPARDLLPSPRV